MTWEYISGFFDADGSILLAKPSKKQPKTIFIHFSNNDYNLLKTIQKFIFKELNLKGSISTKSPKKDTHSIAYELKYGYNAAYLICTHLKSLQIKKKYKIDITLKLYKNCTPRNGKYSTNLLAAKKEFEILFYAI
jgi:hypothetical protein